LTGAGATVLAAGLAAGAVWWAGYPSAAWIAVVAAALWAPALAWRLLRRRAAEVSLDVPARVMRGDDIAVHVGWRLSHGTARRPFRETARRPFRETAQRPFREAAQRPFRGTARLAGWVLGEPIDRSARGGAASLTLVAATRGVLRSELDRVAAIGPFGLVTRPLPPSAPVETLVLPRRHPLAPPRPAALTADAGPAGTRRGGTEFGGFREYALGDDPRSISWAASARTPDRSLMVRQNVLARAVGYHVILDPEADDPEAFETAVDLAYSVAWTVHHTPGHRLVLSTASGGVPEHATGLADAERLLAAAQRTDRATAPAVPRARGPQTLTRVLITAATGPIAANRLVVFRIGPAAPLRRSHAATVFTVPDLAAAARAWSWLVRA
jgi:uncharacterized protein (DUF58 family)